MIDWLIFSKNRPLQLDALLTSMRAHNVPWLSVSVLYNADDSRVREAYRQVVTDHPHVVFRDDFSGFQNGVHGWLELMGPIVAFLTDDCLFIAPAPMPDRDQLPYSYRIGRNTTRAWHGEQTPPDDLSFDWHGRQGDYGYPLSLDGIVYDLDTLLPIFADLTYDNPTQLEAALAGREDMAPPILTMGERNCLVTFAHNRVSVDSRCGFSGLPGHSTDDLLAAYKRGERMRPERMALDHCDFASTMEVPYVVG